MWLAVAAAVAAGCDGFERPPIYNADGVLSGPSWLRIDAGAVDVGATKPNAVDAGAAGAADAGTVEPGASDAGAAALGVDASDGRFRFARWDSLEATLSAGVDWTGMRQPRRVSSALASDLDGDGFPELILNDNRQIYDRSMDQGDTRLFRRGADGVWAVSGALPAGLHGCRIAADLDGDGRVDLLCAAPETAIYWDVGRGLDVERRTVLAPASAVMSASVWDLDEDGLLDVVLARWMDQIGVFRGLGGRRYEEVTEAWGLGVVGSVWEVGHIDLDADDRDDLFVMSDGHAHDNAPIRSRGPRADGEPVFARFDPLPAVDTPWPLFGTSDRSPMGYSLGDLDGDGAQELVLGDETPMTVIAPDPPRGWRFRTRELNLVRELTSTGQQPVPWSPRLWDVDHDGRLDLLIPCGDDEGFSMMPGRGDSLPLFYAGASDGTFTPLHDAAGFTLGHAANATLGDLDGDGDLDVLMGGFGQPLRVYRNDTTPHGRHVLLSLRGTVSNPAGLGARVEVRGALRRSFVYGGHGAPQVTDAPTLDVAVGPSSTSTEVVVRWPSGLVRRWTDVPVGAPVTLEEPAALTITPASRRVAADGASLVTVAVRPVDESGAPRTARVTIESTSPAVRWQGPAQADAAGVVTRVLRAPDAPGSAVVQVTVDGVPWRVRPRVWFGP